MPAETKPLDWAEEVDDVADEAPEVFTREEPDGTRVTVEYKVNEEGKRVKVTRRTRMRLVHAEVNHAVAERKVGDLAISKRENVECWKPLLFNIPHASKKQKWKKFGESAGLGPGPDSTSTSYGEMVYLKMSKNLKVEDQQPVEEEDPLKKALAQGKSKISCRICKGDHWTSKCPFKDTHQPLDEVAVTDSRDSVAESVAADAPTSGKYVPPSLRNRGPGESMKDKRDDFSTIRITNLSEDTTEQDVKDLVSRFGHTSRVFVARDRDTNICKGFGFVSYYHKDDAEKAMKALNGYGYDNLILRVEWARSNKD
ncbi:translation initiation factor eIF3 subunit g [Borealophlyctis nickersoniae]|nr:translation initiation factor eIF3 subunit g [Borealophlyctis nickersoniae]